MRSKCPRVPVINSRRIIWFYRPMQGNGDSGIREIGARVIRNPELWIPEYSSRNPESTNDWNLESNLSALLTDGNPVPGIRNTGYEYGSKTIKSEFPYMGQIFTLKWSTFGIVNTLVLGLFRNGSGTTFETKSSYCRVACHSWVARDVTKNQTKKLSILLSFWLSRGITVPKHLYINKFLVRKGSSFCERGGMNFQAFAWRGI